MIQRDLFRRSDATLDRIMCVLEEQRARAAKAAADFETTLAGRRKAAEDEFTTKMAESQTRLDEANELAERTRTDADHARAEATRDAGRLLEEARQEAARIVSDAKATAERVRADSERELAAASQRRDSINAQLANVRQMLATLTGTAAMPLSAFGAEDEDDAAAGEQDQVQTPDTEAESDAVIDEVEGEETGADDESEDSEESRDASMADSRG